MDKTQQSNDVFEPMPETTPQRVMQSNSKDRAGRTGDDVRDNLASGTGNDNRTTTDPGNGNAGNEEKALARKEMIAGLLWCAGGLAFSFLSYYFTSAGGRYVVATGAILWGAIQALKGLFLMLKINYRERKFGAFWRLAALAVVTLLLVAYLGALSVRIVEGDGLKAVETEQYYGCDSLGLRLKVPAGFAKIEVETHPETDTTYASYDIWTLNETVGVFVAGVGEFFGDTHEGGIAESIEYFGQRDAEDFDAELIVPTRVVEIKGRQMLRAEGRKTDAPGWVFRRLTLRHRRSLIKIEFSCHETEYGSPEAERQIEGIVVDLVFY